MYMMMQIANFWTFLEANVNNIIHSAQLMQLLLHGCVGLGGVGITVYAMGKFLVLAGHMIWVIWPQYIRCGGMKMAGLLNER